MTTIPPSAPVSIPRAPSSSRWSRLRVLLLALVVFASGTMVGGALTLRFLHRQLQSFLTKPEETPDRILPVLRRRLQLTDEQAAKVEQIVRARHQALQQIRRETAPKVRSEFERIEQEVSAVLTPEQKSRWHTRFRQLYLFWFPDLPESNGNGDARPHP